MLVRFTLSNLFSFKEETEFNFLPGNLKRLPHHKYNRAGIEILKMSAIYGANGSGKSNLIHSIALLKRMIIQGGVPKSFASLKFRLSESCKDRPVEIAIEFIVQDLIFYYSITMDDAIVLEEQLSTNYGGGRDEMIFHRKHGKTISIKFSDTFESSEQNLTLKRIIEEDLIRPDRLLFNLLNTLSNPSFGKIKQAYSWIENNLTIILPNTKASGLVLEIESKSGFKEFADEMISSYNTGISRLKVDTRSIEEYFGKDDQQQIDEIRAELKNNPDQKVGVLKNVKTDEEVVFVNENDTIVAKRLLFEHKNEEDNDVIFSFHEESDGTKRLLEYLPALNSVIKDNQTIIIDEIERSIHPLIVKEIVAKLSEDESTLGQLIFTTHESNLLDQEIFRTDEIWFTEKNMLGATTLYPLSDFKVHSTIDIRKGYLNGRYGAIPFLGNLQDLNWHKFHDEKE